MDWEELEWTSQGRRLAAMAWGPSDGHPVLALHGWMDNAASFAELAPRLPTCRVVAIDFSGHGRSDFLPPGSWYHFLDLLSDIDAAFAAMGWPRAHLLGHSMGGALALLFAAAFPDRTLSLISLDALGPLTGQVEQTATRLHQALSARRSARVDGRVFASRVEAIEARCANGDLDAHGVEHLARRGLEELAKGWHWRADRRLRLPTLVRLTEAQVVACIAAVTAPALVLASQASMERFPHLAPLMHRRAKGFMRGQIRYLSGGHHLHLDNAQGCAAAINELLDAQANDPGQVGSE